jgi:GNAT superfamily N-acetyltransferase
MKLIAGGLDLELRAGTVADVPLLLSFIRSMAAFEKLTVSATEESLRTALFGESPAARVLFAFVNGTPVAYATYFFTFGTMAGRRGLWLDDLFVHAGWRGKGIGQALMAYLSDVARQHDCASVEWMVLGWNERAIRFYEGLGARFLDDWRICRLDEEELARVAEMSTGRERGRI